MKIDETWSTEVLKVEALSEGVVAPFQERLVNERRLWPSAGGCLRVGTSLHQYIVVRCFLYNKILKTETTTAVVFSRLGFPP